MAPIKKRKAENQSTNVLKRTALGDTTNNKLKMAPVLKKIDKSPSKITRTKRVALSEVTNDHRIVQSRTTGVKLTVASKKSSQKEKPITKLAATIVDVKKEISQQRVLRGNETKPLLASKQTDTTVRKVSSTTCNAKLLSTCTEDLKASSNATDDKLASNDETVVVREIQTAHTTAIQSTVATDVRLTDASKTHEHGSKAEGTVVRRSSRLSGVRSDGEGSLYVSAYEDISINESVQEDVKCPVKVPEMSEFDKELLHDPHQISLYAMDIFEYLKSRESHFAIDDYMFRQTSINRKMRALLIDWMVEVQENFELFHETLYLAIKIVDTYLSKVRVHKDNLQLVGAAAILLSCKYDERTIPITDDFVIIGDGAYNQNELLAMEQSILCKLNFELGFPISYRFLRRYARCAKIQMPLLTLARYILELAQMEYSTVTLSDSKQAAAALYLAFRMDNHGGWSKSMEYYSGYKLMDFKDIVILFNTILHRKPSESMTNIISKYSHKIFFEVAKKPLISDDELLAPVCE